jgi:hypothetical protein
MECNATYQEVAVGRILRWFVNTTPLAAIDSLRHFSSSGGSRPYGVASRPMPGASPAAAQLGKVQYRALCRHCTIFYVRVYFRLRSSDAPVLSCRSRVIVGNGSLEGASLLPLALAWRLSERRRKTAMYSRSRRDDTECPRFRNTGVRVAD